MTTSSLEIEIRTICQRILSQLGYGHTEKIYQEALATELREHGWYVELERPQAITYVTTQGRQTILGVERIDIFATRGNNTIILELKSATSFAAEALGAQVKKYLREMRSDVIGFGIQFMQPATRAVSDTENVHVIQFGHSEPRA